MTPVSMSRKTERRVRRDRELVPPLGLQTLRPGTALKMSRRPSTMTRTRRLLLATMTRTRKLLLPTMIRTAMGLPPTTTRAARDISTTRATATTTARTRRVERSTTTLNGPLASTRTLRTTSLERPHLLTIRPPRKSITGTRIILERIAGPSPATIKPTTSGWRVSTPVESHRTRWRATVTQMRIGILTYQMRR